MENMISSRTKNALAGRTGCGNGTRNQYIDGAILQSVQNIERRLSPELPRNFEVANHLDLDLSGSNRYLADREVYSFLQTIRDAGERSAPHRLTCLGSPAVASSTARQT